MVSKIHISTRVAVSIMVLALLSITAIPATVAIDPPQIIVNSIWRPASQLDTIDNVLNIGVTDAGDDLRYVDAEIYVTSSVQFWAAEFTCTVDKTVLESYTSIDTGLDPSPDDIPPVTFGAEWSSAGGVSQNI